MLWKYRSLHLVLTYTDYNTSLTSANAHLVLTYTDYNTSLTNANAHFSIKPFHAQCYAHATKTICYSFENLH